MLIDETLGDLDFERGTLDNVISPYEVNNLYWHWKKNNLDLDGAESYLIELIGRNHMEKCMESKQLHESMRKTMKTV